MKLHISVTAEHIRQGCRYNCRSCPVALAFRDAGIADVMVFNPCVGLAATREAVAPPTSIFLPQRVQDFIRAFDHGTVCQPFEFDIDWPRSVY